MDEKYMKIAIELANKAFQKNEVPIGALIVKNNKIISKGYNTKERTHSIIKHAEVNAIENACKKLKTYHLENCIMYVTLEPCMMCTAAIDQSHISKVVYSLDSDKYGFLRQYNKIPYENGLLQEESLKLLQEFFKKKRGQ